MVFNCHIFLPFFFFNFKIIGNMPLMNIGFNRWNHSVFSSPNKRLIHLILVSQIGHLVALWSIGISTKLLLFSSFCLLSCFNPLLIVCKLFMALLSFFHELSFLWTDMLMMVTIFNWSERMSYIVLAIHCWWLSHFNCFLILIIVNNFSIFPIFTSKNKI